MCNRVVLSKNQKVLCNHCQKQVNANLVSCPKCGKPLGWVNELAALKQHWELQREQITFYVCLISLVGLLTTSTYAFINIETLPDVIKYPVAGFISLLTFSLLGYVTRIQSITRAVADSIRIFFQNMQITKTGKKLPISSGKKRQSRKKQIDKANEKLGI